ncbi:MAG: peptidoglycan-binding protein [Thermoleophilaceae bacterium]|nr:peptidoglycan-binding protein [Thermoleophilaceae bacterium]
MALDLDTPTRFEEGEATLVEEEVRDLVREAGEPPLEEGGPAGDPGAIPELTGVASEDDERTAAGERRAMRLSKAGVAFIARFEGFRSDLYNDAAGHCTIGYGHLVHHGRCNGSEPAEFKSGIGRERALELLHQRAGQFGAAVNGLGVALNQHQFDALVSFTFNLGPGWLGGSGLQRALAAGDYDAVPRELSRWVFAGGRKLQGLVKRRRAEGELFARGKSVEVSGGGEPGEEAPPWPGRLLAHPPPLSGEDVRQWQSQMAKRGWRLAVDGAYGARSEEVCRSFQQERGLAVDGKVGSDTWQAAWAAPVT